MTQESRHKYLKLIIIVGIVLIAFFILGAIAGKTPIQQGHTRCLKGEAPIQGNKSAIEYCDQTMALCRKNIDDPACYKYFQPSLTGILD